jgi:hypothetical protein
VDPERIRFPKSKRLVEQGRNSVAPLGWLKIENGEASPTTEVVQEQQAEPVIIKPQFYEGKINYKKPPILDAVVIQSDRPNKVQVYLAPENTVELSLDRYRNPLDEGTIIQVTTQFNKKGKLLQVSFKSLKG